MIDQQIGSLLERWINRDTDGCRFCNSPIDGDPAPPDQFCSDACESKFDDVHTARLHIGKRDLQQRGFD